MSKEDRTVADVQNEIADALERLPQYANALQDLKALQHLFPPKGTHPEVSFHRNTGTKRKIPTHAGAGKWDPKSDSIVIRFQPTGGEEPGAGETSLAARPTEPKPAAAVRQTDPLHDVVLALERAERDPQLHFVSLKWFRDTYLLQQGFAWTASQPARQEVLVQAIEKRWVLTSKVPNPKAPEYPVTAIRLNRPHSQVQAILSLRGATAGDFDPIPVRGQPLSETVLRERR